MKRKIKPNRVQMTFINRQGDDEEKERKSAISVKILKSKPER